MWMRSECGRGRTGTRCPIVVGFRSRLRERTQRDSKPHGPERPLGIQNGAGGRSRALPCHRPASPGRGMSVDDAQNAVDDVRDGEGQYDDNERRHSSREQLGPAAFFGRKFKALAGSDAMVHGLQTRAGEQPSQNHQDGSEGEGTGQQVAASMARPTAESTKVTPRAMILMRIATEPRRCTEVEGEPIQPARIATNAGIADTSEDGRAARGRSSLPSPHR